MKIFCLKKGLLSYRAYYAGLNPDVWRLVLFNWINSIILGICYFLPVYFVTQLKLDIATAGMIISSYATGTIVGSVVSGKLSDKLSPNLISTIFLGIEGIAFSLLAHLNSALFLCINLFILGIGAYGFITANYAAALQICQHSKELRLKTINILDTSANVGLGIAAIIIGALSTKCYSYLFNLAGFSLLIICLLLTNRRGFYKKITVNKVFKEQDQTALPKNYNNKAVYHALLCLFATGLIISQLSGTYSIYLNQLFPDDKARYFGFIFAFNTFFIGLLQTPASYYLSRYNQHIVISFGVFLLGLGMSLLVISDFFIFIILSCVVYTIGEIFFFSFAQAICYENTQPKSKGSILGLFRMIYAISRVIGPITGAYIYQQFGSVSLWTSCGLLGSIYLLATLNFYKIFKQPEYSHNL